MKYSRYRNVKSMQDIKLEKAKLKYDMLVAENRLLENFSSIEKLFTITSFFTRFMDGFKYARNFYHNFHKYANMFMFWRKDKSEKDDDSRSRED